MAEDASAGADRVIAFGRFRVQRAQQVVLDGDRPLRIGSRALALLTALVDHAGEVVSKKDLTPFAWPNRFVEESNVRVHIAGLRRALGDGQAGNRYVVAVPGRGYRFVAPVALSQGVAADPPATVAGPSNLPPRLTRVIGRSNLVGTLSAQLIQRRFLTLVGPGGIGNPPCPPAIPAEAPSACRGG